MQDLRIRFGVILAISLLPLLVFAMVQSLFDFRSDSEDRILILKNAALSAASEVVTSIDNNQSILRVFGETLDPGSDCTARLRDGISAIPQLVSLEIFDNAGQSVCRVGERSDSSFIMPEQGQLTPEMPFRTETVSTVLNEDRIHATFVSTYGVFEDGNLERVIFGSFKVSNLQTMEVNPLLADDAHIGLINRRGEALIGGRGQTVATRLDWVKSVNDNGIYQGRIERASGEVRDIIVVETDSDGIYVAVSTPQTSLFSWSVLNPFSSLLVPILAWLFGFLAIWLATDQLILAHLRRMQRGTIKFAAGDMSERIGTLKNPPQSIFTLGKNFDMMADQIMEREATITDSLKEKETLLREIHHRVKNNLQIIISLLNMQERKLEDASAKGAIVETRSRINAIALVHRGLYESQDLRFVDMQVFLERLMSELSVAFGLPEKNIQTVIRADCDPMEADVATPIALFVVEALTNAVKHGVPQGGRVNIEIRESGEDVSVIVSDTGASSTAAPTGSTGTGTKLIKGFARQLGGTVEVDESDDGYKIELNFKMRSAQTFTP